MGPAHCAANILTLPSCLQVYEHIQALPRWQLHNGRDFMFFDPHPGFARGRSAVAWVAAWCHELRDAVQLVPDGHGNGRLQCTEAGDMPTQLVLVPYVRTLAHPLQVVPHSAGHGAICACTGPKSACCASLSLRVLSQH